MNAPLISTFVVGDPAPQGSKRHVGRGILVESSQRVKPWRADVREALRAAAPISGPVAISFVFYFARPASHYGTGRNAGVLKVGAPARPTSRRLGDVDKLCRSTLDAITSAGVIADDDEVVELFASKRYVDEASDPQGERRTGCLLSIMSAVAP